jgi:hypothetical protein
LSLAFALPHNQHVVEQLAVKLKADVGRWEEEVFRWTCSLAQEVAKALLESIDEDLMRQKDEDLKVEALKPHRIVTVFGDVWIKRRMYRDSNGKYRFLLDEKMGLDKGCQVSPKVKELATFLSSHFPFQRTEEILRSILPTGISHTSIHRLVARVTDPYLEAEEKELEEVFRDGVIPASERRVVPHLFLEADGTSVALQREEARRAEVKVGVAYEGWQGVSKDRHRVTMKTVYSGIMNGDRFWEGFSLTLAKKYDLSQVGRVIVGGDGASWVKTEHLLHRTADAPAECSRMPVPPGFVPTSHSYLPYDAYTEGLFYLLVLPLATGRCAFPPLTTRSPGAIFDEW